MRQSLTIRYPTTELAKFLIWINKEKGSSKFKKKLQTIDLFEILEDPFYVHMKKRDPF